MTTTPEYAKGGIVSGKDFAPAPDSGKELVSQFTNDAMRYFPEWNDKEIAEKKVELSFAYMFGHTEDINKLESDIETLTEKLRRAQNGT